MCSVVNLITQVTQVTQMVEAGVLVQRKKKSLAYGVERIANVTGRRSLL